MGSGLREEVHTYTQSLEGNQSMNERQILVILAGVALLSACKDTTRPDPPAAVQPVSPTSVSAAVGTAVPLQVKVTTAGGVPVAGARVTWTATAGTVQPAASTTDAQGLTTVAWTLGTAAGEQTAAATMEGLPPARFTAAAKPGEVDTLAFATTPDSVQIGHSFKLQVVVKDQYGNLIPDASVSFSSSDSALVSVDAAGTVKAIRPGTAMISATSGKRAATAKVVVRQLPSVRISAGTTVTCGVQRKGDAYCWGAGGAGQLGNGMTSSSTTPVQVSGGHIFTSVEVMNGHACGVTAGSAAYCWGINNLGQLGTTTTQTCGSSNYPCSTIPVRVSGGHTFRTVSVGYSHTCGITTDDQTYCWGNLSVERSADKVSPSFTPVLVSGGHKFQAIDAGESYTCGLTAEGGAYCWGNNESGQFGDGTRNNSAAPVLVSGSHRFRSISTGSYHTCAVTTTDQAYCWGASAYGALGTGSMSQVALAPVPVSGALKFASVSAENLNTCGTTTAGLLYCWGDNRSGQLGNGTSTNSAVPQTVTGDLRAASVDVGHYYACATTTAGAAYCWGQNWYGMLGDGTTSNRSTPVAVKNFGSP